MMQTHYIQRIKKYRSLVPKGTPSLVDYFSEDFTPSLKAQHSKSLEALSDLIPLDYMGSAEFEFGVVPSSLRKICRTRAQYAQFKVPITGYPENSRKYIGTELLGWAIPSRLEEITRFIIDETNGSNSTRYHVKEPTYMRQGCFGKIQDGKLSDSDICSWLCLNDEPWFIGTNRDQINGLAKLLGLQ